MLQDVRCGTCVNLHAGQSVDFRLGRAACILASCIALQLMAEKMQIYCTWAFVACNFIADQSGFILLSPSPRTLPHSWALAPSGGSAPHGLPIRNVVTHGIQRQGVAPSTSASQLCQEPSTVTWQLLLRLQPCTVCVDMLLIPHAPKPCIFGSGCARLIGMPMNLASHAMPSSA